MAERETEGISMWRPKVAEAIRAVSARLAPVEGDAVDASTLAFLAHEQGVLDVLSIRCLAHRNVPQINGAEASGGECGECARLAGVVSASAPTVAGDEVALWQAVIDGVPWDTEAMVSPDRETVAHHASRAFGNYDNSPQWYVRPLYAHPVPSPEAGSGETESEEHHPDCTVGLFNGPRLAVGEPVAWILYSNGRQTGNSFETREKGERLVAELMRDSTREYELRPVYINPPAAPMPEVTAEDIEWLRRVASRQGAQMNPRFARILTALQAKQEGR